MNRERWQRVEVIFHAALERSAEERRLFVEQACAGDTSLQQEVAGLLAYDDPNTSFIERPVLESLEVGRESGAAESNGSETAEATLLSDTPPDAAHAGDELPAGSQVQNFRIVRKIGAGGMGEVYLAENLRLGRRVALKLLPGSLHVGGQGGRRYLREARAASALNHPNIVTIYSAGEADGLSFIEMEYIEGESLRERLLRGPLDVREVIALGLQAADAAAAAHAINIVHRDLKPGNILLTAAGQAKVVDFGLAKVADAAAVAAGGTSAAAPAGAVSLTSVSLSQAGSISGTVPYMSPEQTRGEHIDARSDMFSLGCVLYEAATGRRPFDGTIPAEIIEKIRETDPPRPSVARPGLPRMLDAVILRALAKDKDQRYRTAMDLAADLRRVKTRVAVRQFVQRIRVPAAIMAVVAVVLLGWDYQRRQELRRAAENAQRATEELARVPALIDDLQTFEAYDLVQREGRYVPDDPLLTSMKPWITDVLSVTTDPAGAGVYLTRYQPDANGQFPQRQLIGETPLKAVEIARGEHLLQIEKAGYEPFQRMISSALGRIENGLWSRGKVRHTELTQDPSGKFGIKIDSDAPIEIDIALHRAGSIPEGMVYVPGGDYDLVAWDRPTKESVPLDEFFIDQCEVTNREFEAFIAAGGYENRSFWKVPLVDHDPERGESRELSWEEAMEVLRQPGRKGPASWSEGRCAADREDHPVTNVCWYEAAAYAEFRGKKLPTIYQWEHAARGGADEKRWTVYWPSTKPWGLVDLDENLQYRANMMSTLASNGTTPVGTYAFGISPYGCYDMCGNVTEWCLNARPDGFTTTGGSWHDGPNLFAAVGEYPGFYCADTVGFRCALNSSGASGDQGGMPFPRKADEVPKFEPVSEDKFQLLRAHYEYVRPPLKPLDAKVIEDVDAKGWRRLKISYIGAEGQRIGTEASRERRGLAYLWLPKSARPPYQVINYKPGGPSYQGLFAWQETEVVCGPFILEGRAVFVALVEGMRERDLPPEWEGPKPDTIGYRDMMVYDTIDQRRGLDYLATRDDIDMERIACMGLSLGGYDMVIMAVEERFHAIVLLAAGLGASDRSVIAEANPVNFAPYIKAPKLMIHGRYDEGLPLRTEGQPLYDLLSEPKDGFVVLPTGHFPPMHLWPQYVDAFLNREFGPVKPAPNSAAIAQEVP